jgi:hypothetical protein
MPLQDGERSPSVVQGLVFADMKVIPFLAVRLSWIHNMGLTYSRGQNGNQLIPTIQYFLLLSAKSLTQKPMRGQGA